MSAHPDMIETAEPRPSRHRRKATPAPPTAPGKNPPRPVLGKGRLRGLRRLIDAMALVPCDAELRLAVDYLTELVAWHEHPAITAKRKARGASVKNWELSQQAK